jgi:Ca2+-binding EF-hand superfamily protein
VNLYKGDEIVDTVTIVVLGDVDGNGVIDTTDCVRVKAAFLGVYKLSAAEAIAADVDKNGTIDTTDFVRVKAHFLGTYDLHQ